MPRRTTKGKIISSTVTLFVAIVFAALCWSVNADGIFYWCGFTAMLLCMVSLRQMSNGNALIRARTWIVPATFVALNGAFPSVHPLRPEHIGVIAYAFSQFYLFRSYQEFHAERTVVASFAFLGVAGLICPPILLLAIPHFISLLVQLRAFHLRTFVAGLIGLSIPLELFVALWFSWDDMAAHFPLWTNLWTNFWPSLPPQWAEIDFNQSVNISIILLLFLIGCMHYLHTNFNDKIRVRMCFYVIMLQGVSLFLLITLMPHFSYHLFPFLLLEVSPMMGHYLMFSYGRWANVFSFLIVALVLGAATFNLWNSSLLSF